MKAKRIIALLIALTLAFSYVSIYVIADDYEHESCYQCGECINCEVTDVKCEDCGICDSCVKEDENMGNDNQPDTVCELCKSEMCLCEKNDMESTKEVQELIGEFVRESKKFYLELSKFEEGIDEAKAKIDEVNALWKNYNDIFSAYTARSGVFAGLSGNALYVSAYSEHVTAAWNAYEMSFIPLSELLKELADDETFARLEEMHAKLVILINEIEETVGKTNSEIDWDAWADQVQRFLKAGIVAEFFAELNEYLKAYDAAWKTYLDSDAYRAYQQSVADIITYNTNYDDVAAGGASNFIFHGNARDGVQFKMLEANWSPSKMDISNVPGQIYKDENVTITLDGSTGNSPWKLVVNEGRGGLYEIGYQFGSISHKVLVVFHGGETYSLKNPVADDKGPNDFAIRRIVPPTELSMPLFTPPMYVMSSLVEPMLELLKMPRHPVFTVTYVANGGVGGPHIDANQAPWNYTTLSLRETGISREGWIFQGWATGSDASVVSHPVGFEFTITGDVWLYAIWAQGSGGSGGGRPASETVMFTSTGVPPGPDTPETYDYDDPEIPYASPPSDDADNEPYYELDDPEIPLANPPLDDDELDEPEVPRSGMPQTGIALLWINLAVIGLAIILIGVTVRISVNRRKF